MPATEIALNNDCTVDGTHPNDLSMQYYADAYEKIIRKILSEPVGGISTTKFSIVMQIHTTGISDISKP